jgi:glutamate racemase
MDQRPIGVFDSGLGGLTAAKALEELMPGEDLIYYRDSANAPNGTRSREELAQLATANAAFLQRFDCKAVLVACGTVSSNAIDLLRARFDFPFFGVIDAAARAALQATKTGRIAVIATEATVNSGAFERKLRALGAEAVFSKACQSLVAVTEAGHLAPDDPAVVAAVSAELAPVRDWAPDTLILACTHFPLLEPAIAAELGAGVRLLSCGAEAARDLRAYLEENGATAARSAGTQRYFTSGDPAYFSACAARFLGRPITAERKKDGGSAE